MKPNETRIVITGVGLTAPNGNNLAEFRKSLLSGKSGIQKFNVRYMGEVLAGICHFDPLKYQKKKELRRGTRAGSIAIYCTQEAIADAKAVKETALANAKLALEEAFTPRLQSILTQKLREEAEEGDDDMQNEELDSSNIGTSDVMGKTPGSPKLDGLSGGLIPIEATPPPPAEFAGAPSSANFFLTYFFIFTCQPLAYLL